ncbi:ribonuclease H [Trifolium pratense]|uniref:Ribonuclease H n=1 Tax=Trifolium pratense TaxID=57577 RepID=A0A2K3PI28_TRIPR|nr:ribonuclease H [Trifolium pratense]
MVRWNAQDDNGMILNVDGSSIGISNILHAELLAMYNGLVLAWELDIKDLWCYSDSKTVIKLLSDHVNE